MRKRLISIALVLCMCVSVLPVTANAYMSQKNLSEVRSEDGLRPYANDDTFSYQTVYEAMIALKEDEKYLEGTTWTDYTPYSDGNYYSWKGGTLGGSNILAVGCVAFAFELSDAAFGGLPARMYSNGEFTFEDVKVGDILRVNNDAHTVIVLQVFDTGVEIAEGNYSGKVHWGRTLTKEDVEAASHYITRYPVGYDDSGDPDADAVIANGSAGGLDWTLTNAGTLTISGNGPMPNYSGSSDQPWNNYADSILKIVIGDGVTSIGNAAFYGNKAFSVTIPNSVTAIGDNAFYKSSLISADIPASVKTIGDSAFRECANLSSVSISEGVETIDQNAFRACQELKSIALPASVVSVGAAAFFQCTEMTSATFATGSNQVTIGDNLFTECWKLSTVILPQSINCISEAMFQNCLLLSSLIIPQGAASIGGSAFASCGRLTEITIPDSVTTIGTAAFSACSMLTDIYFTGSEEQWNGIGKSADVTAALVNVTIHYNSSVPDLTPGHTHSWAEEWSSDAAYHWHECTVDDCTVTGNSQKDGYAAHVYDSDADTTCNICGYTRSVNDDTSSPGDSSGSLPGTSDIPDSSLPDIFDFPSVPSAPTVPTTSTTENPDGSVTITTENTATGTITETTKNADGSQTVVETRTDGTVTTTETDQFGNRTETVNMPDGSSVTNIARSDGATAAVITSGSGQTAAEVTLPAATVNEAQRSGETVALPIPGVWATRDSASAPVVTVKTGSNEPVKVEIPTENVTSGTVAVIVNADGSEEIVKATISTENGVAVPLPDGATVKIVDNSKTFADVSAAYWASDAINFASARELLSGTTEATFTPEAPMTRGMLMTVLARYDGEDTSGGVVWYEKGMAWAVANAISDGSDPDSNITREQLVTMLWRYSGSPAASSTLNAFADAGEISEYAWAAMCWAAEQGIISGFENGMLEPQGQATRAEAAVMLMRYTSNA